MFKIFYDTLVRPKKIVNHVDEKKPLKFFGFILLTIIILVLPSLIINILSTTISDEELATVVETIESVDDINYKIENNKLICTTESAEPVVLRFPPNSFILTFVALGFEKPIYVIFSAEDVNYEKLVVEDSSYVVLLLNDHVEVLNYKKPQVVNGQTNLSGNVFEQQADNEQLIKSFAYDTYNLNFNKSEVSDTRLNTDLYYFCDFLYGKLDSKYILLTSFSILFTVLQNLIISIATTLLITGLFFRFMGVPFKKMLKITFLCYTPYVVGSSLSVCFGISAFSIIGEIIALIYTYRVMRTYSMIIILKKRSE